MSNQEKLGLGIIGTSSISNQFIEAALGTNNYVLDTVYSRKERKARSFGESYGANYFTESLDDLASRSEVDVVYIASPNSLHYEQAIEMIEAGKHVIIEKPIFSTPKEWSKAFSLSLDKGVFIFEAARHIHEPNFQKVKDEIQKIDHIQGASLTYMKYSSRYDAVLNGEEPPIFSLDYSGGALMDLGIYLVYAAVSWFGEPDEVRYLAQKIRTGVDGQGVGILRYPNFDVTIHCGKNAQSFHATEIYGLDETLIIDKVTTPTLIQDVKTRSDESTKEDLPANSDNPLTYEAKAFTEILLNPEEPTNKEKYHEWLKLSQTVNRLITEMRYDAEIYFPNRYGENYK